MLRFLPAGVFLYLIGGTLFGFGACLGTAFGTPGVTALGCTGIGATLIAIGYFILRPLLREAKAEIKARTRAQWTGRDGEEPAADAEPAER